MLTKMYAKLIPNHLLDFDRLNNKYKPLNMLQLMVSFYDTCTST